MLKIGLAARWRSFVKRNFSRFEVHTSLSPRRGWRRYHVRRVYPFAGEKNYGFYYSLQEAVDAIDKISNGNAYIHIKQ
ncbi:hypothetical protein [Gibbsiella quercinecans]|uniref:hypothetical protein n=1 Tax=Gibbsiella quercinecans TaxID=929813 RepID=UPI00242EBA5D|nr:hypothetical protein [Gibbsiella quercinecans]